MLGIGIDWAEEFHLVALGTPEQGVMEITRVSHTPAAVAELIARVGGLEPVPDRVRVVIETSHGMLVEALLDAGFQVVPVNPDLIARRRGPARKKDDAEDARIACLLALDQHAGLRPLIAHGEVGSELRAIARDDERAARDERRLLNRLRADLIATFPAALVIAGDDLGAPTMLRLRQRWPTAVALEQATTGELAAFARAGRHGWPDRFAAQVRDALAGEVFTAREALIRGKTDTIVLATSQLLLHTQRRVWEKRMGQLLLGAPRRGRNHTPSVEESGPCFPGGEIYLSFPGLGDRLAARVAGEIGEHIDQFTTANALACYAGKAPVTRRSGKSQYVVSCRLACNRYLRDAVQQWAFCSLRRSVWARQFYDTQIARGHGHHAALRALGNRWIEILWHCVSTGTPYDEAVHMRNRAHAQPVLDMPAAA